MYKRDPETNREMYIYNPFDQKYVYNKREDDTEVFAMDENNQPYYATDNSGREYYPKVFGEEEYTNQIRYIRDESDREIYPIKKLGNYFFELYDSVLGYAKDFQNNEYYAKNQAGDQYPFETFYAKDRHGLEMYPITRNDRRFYIKDSNGNELLAKSSLGDEYYITSLDGKTSHFPKTKNGEQFYAKTGTGKEIYGVATEYPSLGPQIPILNK